MIKNQHAVAVVPVIAMILGIVGLVFGGWLIMNLGKIGDSSSANRLIVCTDEAKMCPDGTAVGRSGPSCEFAACPTRTYSSTAAGASEKTTYSDTNFSFEYPKLWGTPSESHETETDQREVYNGSVAPVTFIVDNFWYELGVYSDGFDASAAYRLETSKVGTCVDGEATLLPGKDGLKVPCKNVTLSGQKGILLVRSIAQEGCYDAVREYYFDWPHAPYAHFVAHQGGVEINDIPGEHGAMYCTQDIDVQKRLTEILNDENLSPEQHFRNQEFDAAVRDLMTKKNTDSTAKGMKSYMSDAGYLLQYPAAWTLNEINQYLEVVPPSTVAAGYGEGSVRLIVDRADKIETDLVSGQHTVTINGVKATQQTEPGLGVYMVTYFPKDNGFLRVTFDQDVTRAEFAQILASFKLTE